jgi:hypothetical protein
MATRTRKLGLSGFDRDEEAAFRALFASAGAPGWTLAPEAEAEALLFDIDSMYGQMGWLRAQGGPRKCAVVTMALRAEADYVLHRPVTREGLLTLLQQLAGEAPAAASAAPAAAASEPDASGHGASEPDAGEPAAAAPKAQVHDAPTSATAITAEHPAAPAAPAAASKTYEPAAEPATAPAAAPARTHRLLHYLDPDVLPGPVRLRDAEPSLAFDPHAFTYAGGLSLKPLAEHCRRAIAPGDWEPLSTADYERLKNQLGGTQPLSRLRWLAGLYGHEGHLAPELAAASRFKLGKWPQSEREYPKHFRIATALLKQPGSIEELAAASGANAADVADFINACHAIGIIEADGAAATPAGDATARGGLMSRLRGKP